MCLQSSVEVLNSISLHSFLSSLCESSCHHQDDPFGLDSMSSSSERLQRPRETKVHQLQLSSLISVGEDEVIHLDITVNHLKALKELKELL